MGWYDGSTPLPYTYEQATQLEAGDANTYRGWLAVERKKAEAEMGQAKAAASRLAAERDAAAQKAEASERRIGELDRALRALNEGQKKEAAHG